MAHIRRQRHKPFDVDPEWASGVRLCGRERDRQ
jgi:hypothetical protein